jgi:3-oxoacyl-[acyl-carrier protein] reductase
VTPALAGRRALVTGASRGIGAAIARSLGAAGASLVAVARREGPLLELRDELKQIGATCEVVVGDVSTKDGADRIVESVQPGGVDILVNNVGGGREEDVLRLSEAAWERTLQRNLMSTVRLCTALAPGMCERGWGRIVNIGSTSAREPDPRLADYAAAKAAMIAYSKALSLAVAGRGVSVTCVLPGPTRTERLSQRAREDAARFGTTEEEALRRLEAPWNGPMGRWVTPHEVAELVAFLCSDSGGFVAGTSVVIDGGTIRCP